jgi:cyclohexyl-isocyanide hydratase
MSAFGRVSPNGANVCVRGPSGHRAELPECPLLTQSGHCQTLGGCPELARSRRRKPVRTHGLTQLDFTGPLQVLSRLPQSATHIVAKSGAPVPSDCGLGLVPTHTFANCPPLDLICIPGGSEGVAGIINDSETIEFVRQQAGAAKYITAVCTGAFVLGVAGLLRGRRATTHWAYTDLLPLVGATYEKARIVKDGNVVTAGGVTAGIDFGLSVVAEIAGETTARKIQLGIEYDPAPPFDSGHPDRAPTIKSELLSARYDKFRAIYRTRIEQAAATNLA